VLDLMPMKTVTRPSSFEAPSRAAMWATVELMLTSVHHAYGAYVYATPWRYHVVLIAIVIEAVIVGSLLTVRAWPRGVAGDIARRTFAVVTIVFPVLLIGGVEGLFNHVVKDMLYFAGASASIMTQLFPPPRYEMPDNWFFETTGVLQVLPAGFTAWYISAAIRKRRASRSARAAVPQQ
jgi:hypothetical protein